MFFVITGVSLIFVATWVMKSESTRAVLKNELKRLKSQIGSCERERFMLAEKLTDLEAAPPSSDFEVVKTLERENERLKSELDEAKGSLEEIYKALVEKKA